MKTTETPRRFKKTKNQLPIYCKFDEIADPEKLKVHPKNYNNHPAEQVSVLENVILKNGWRSPVVVSTRSGLIIKGHCRRLVAIKLRDTCPVEYQHYETEADELRDLIADNRAGELSEKDASLLQANLEELEKLNPENLIGTGFSLDLLREMSKPPGGKASKPQKMKQPVIHYDIIFENEDQQNHWFNFLKYLKEKYPDLPTVAQRMAKHIQDFTLLHAK